MTLFRKKRSSWGVTRMANGVVSPKVAIPTGLLLIAGAALMILDLAGIVTVEDELWIALLGAGGVAGGTGYRAQPGPVVTDEGA